MEKNITEEIVEDIIANNVIMKTIKVYPEKQAEYRKKYYERIKVTDDYKEAVRKAKKSYYMRNADQIKEKRRKHYQKMKELKELNENQSLEINT